MKKTTAIFLVLILICGLTAGCGSKTDTGAASAAASSAEKSLRIGVCLFTKNDEWLADIADQFEKQCADKGYEVNIQDGNQENEKQVQQIENFITKKYDAIVLSAADVEGILPAIDKCQEAGIPVIAIDTPIDHPWISTCISWDNYKSGQMLGEYAVKYIQDNLADKDSVNLVMLDGTGYPHLEKRDEGFLDALKDVENLNLVARQCTNGNRELSANVINNNIAKGIDIVYGVVDNHAWGAVTALQEAKAKKCAVLSCGGFGEEPFTALENDDPYYKAIIVVPPENIVTDSIAAVEKVLAGESVEPITNIEISLADHNNVKDFVK
ncbi:sugar ABC transporter substrate-binding protein [Diplocloster modestus]|uniref:Substrate-binding domain-containing protein n=1 Tax=Diplocloster modestus TaxID=2850322 RepID=A0ABS6KDP2_9FIRM|nr:substrate-binding domain-containing protein [Diplocloster modestus]MBU9728635.1 substrate-binding domain-containing protein [Diplocloster modestus]